MKKSCFFHRWVLGEFFYASPSLVWLFRTAKVSTMLLLNLEGLALPMLLLPPHYTPNSAASWALLQDTTFFCCSFPSYFPFFLSSVISRGRYCLCAYAASLLCCKCPACPPWGSRGSSSLHYLVELSPPRTGLQSPLASCLCPCECVLGRSIADGL